MARSVKVKALLLVDDGTSVNSKSPLVTLVLCNVTGSLRPGQKTVSAADWLADDESMLIALRSRFA